MAITLPRDCKESDCWVRQGRKSGYHSCLVQPECSLHRQEVERMQLVEHNRAQVQLGEEHNHRNLSLLLLHHRYARNLSLHRILKEENERNTKQQRRKRRTTFT